MKTKIHVKTLCLLISFLSAYMFAQTPTLIIPAGQSSYIYSIKHTPNGKYKLVASMDGIIKIFDNQKDKEVYRFTGHRGDFRDMDISVDGTYVLSAGFIEGISGEETYSEIILWEIKTGKILKTFRWEDEKVWSVAVSPDMKTCVLGSAWGTIAKVRFPDLQIIEEYSYTNHGIEKVFYTTGDYIHFFAPSLKEEVDSMTVNYGTVNLLNMEPEDGDAFSFSSASVHKVFRDDAKHLYFSLKNPNQLRVYNNAGTEWIENARIETGECVINDFVRKREGEIMMLAVNQEDGTGYLSTYDEVQKTFTANIQIDYQFSQFSSHNTLEKIPDNNTAIILNPQSKMTYLKINTQDGSYQTYNKEPYFWSAYFNTDGGIDLLNAMGFKKFDLQTNAVEDLTSSPFEPEINTSAAAYIHDGYYTIPNPKDASTILVNQNTNEVKSIKSIYNGIATIDHEVAIYANWIGPEEYVIGKLDLTQDVAIVSDTLRIKEEDLYYFHYTALSKDELLYAHRIEDTGELEFVVRDFSKDTAKKFKLDFGTYSHQNPYFAFIDGIEVYGNYLFLMAGANILVYDYDKRMPVKEIKLDYPGRNFHFIKTSQNPFLSVSTKNGKLIRIDAETLKIETVFLGHQTWIHNVDRSANGHFILTSSSDNTNRIWDENTGELLATLYFIGEKDWVIYDEQTKLFDASPEAMNKIHYVVNKPEDEEEPWKIIEFSRLKHRYYQPNLLSIKLGLSAEKIRQAPDMQHVPLAPKIKASIENNKLQIQLIDQDGGIGKTALFINGAEILEDITQKNTHLKDRKSIYKEIELSDFNKRWIEGENEIKIIAENAEGWIVSEPFTIKYTHLLRKGAIAKPKETPDREPPSFYALIVGVADYQGNEIDLKYPGKDAEDIAFALQQSAENLFGQDKVYIHLLHSEVGEQSRFPTKDNIIAYFNSIKDKIQPTDIFMVYFAGHGINYGGAEGDFYFLTQDAAYLTDSYFKDKKMRDKVALSSYELTDYLNQITALKKILILDACASGKAAENMVSARNVPASQIRSLDRLQDRTGFYVLAGSAADAESYESSVYNQGLLTYSILKAIKGNALRVEGEEEYIDIQKLLNYVVDEVPKLAMSIGGVQQPFFKSPAHQQSYDIGRVDNLLKGAIKLTTPRPVLLTSYFIDANEVYDSLNLSKKLDAYLENRSYENKEKSFSFSYAREIPNAYRISGTYRYTEEKIELMIAVTQNNIRVGNTISLQVDRDKNVDDMVQEIYDQVMKRIFD